MPDRQVTSIEGLNPTRRLKWFRARQAMRGAYTTGSPSNYNSVGLLNGGNVHYLVVRDWQTTATGRLLFSYQQSKPAGATNIANQGPVLYGQNSLSGQLWTYDNATLYTNTDYEISDEFTGSYWHDFPFAVIPPNTSLVLQQQSQGGSTIAFVCIWECIYPEELDYFLEL